MCEKKKTHTKNVNIYRDYHILYNVIILYEVSYILRTNRILYIYKYEFVWYILQIFKRLKKIKKNLKKKSVEIGGHIIILW